LLFVSSKKAQKEEDMIYSIWMFLLAGFFGLIPEQPTAPCADLVILRIDEPDWDSENQQTVFTVHVKNVGQVASRLSTVKASDLDISLEAVNEITTDTLVLDLIQENNERAVYYAETEPDNAAISQTDYDSDWMLIESVAPLQPMQSIEIEFRLDDHWIYDSNCEIKVELDVENTVRECDETNNVDYFFAWG
jgi:hypothetical protein